MTQERDLSSRRPSPLGPSGFASGTSGAQHNGPLSVQTTISHNGKVEGEAKARVPPQRRLSSPIIGSPAKSVQVESPRSVNASLQLAQSEGSVQDVSSDETESPQVALSGQSSMYTSSHDLPTVQSAAEKTLMRISPTYSSSSNLIGRAHQRENEALSLFGLPSSEALIDDWNCALQSHRGLLLQGHLYLFLQFICFYSNVFGVSKKLIFPCKDVIAIRKRKNVGVIPNSIEVVYRGKDYFFTSFLNRDDAYNCLCSQWYQSSDYSRLFDPKRSLSAPLEGHHYSAPDLAHHSGQTTPSDSDGGGKPRKGRKKNKKGRQAMGCLGGPGCVMADSNLQEEGNATDTTANNEDNEESSASDDEDNSEPSSESVSWKLHGDLAPPASPRFKPLCSRVLKCTPRAFFDHFLHKDSIFWKAMLEEMGNREVKFDDWMCHPKLGHVRNVSFVAPVKATFAPPETRCHQSQRYCVFAGNHLTLDTSQFMTDIPYGDHFSVEMHWDVTERPGSSCSVSVFIDIPFSRKTMFKGTIEKTSMAESTAFFQRWMELAELQLAESPSGDSIFCLQTPRSSQAGSTEIRAAGSPVIRLPSLNHWDQSEVRRFRVDHSRAAAPRSRGSALSRLPGAGLAWSLVRGVIGVVTSAVQAGVSVFARDGDSKPPSWACVLLTALLLQPSMRLIGDVSCGGRSVMTAAQQAELQLRTIQLQDKMIQMQQEMMELQQQLAQRSYNTDCKTNKGPFGWRG